MKDQFGPFGAAGKYVMNQMYNNKTNNQSLSEGLQYKDFDGLVKPTIHVDEFSSKMGDDKDIIVVSFFVRDKSVARDMEAWLEKGYDFVLDADRSPGEIKPNRYLVYVEIRRRSSAPGNIQEILHDLNTLTEFEPSDWIMHYEGKTQPWSEQAFRDTVPCTPKDYEAAHKQTEKDLNEWRIAAGLVPKKLHKPDSELRSWQSAAGI